MKKISKTADGVLPKPGMILFVKIQGGQAWMQHCEKVASINPDGQVISAYIGTVFPGGVMDMKVCYADAGNIKDTHQ